MTVLSTVDGRVVFEYAWDLRHTIKEAARRNSNFQDIDLRGADLRGIDLHEAKLCGVDLTGACLIDTDLRYVNFGGSNLYNVDFTGANLEMAQIEDCNAHCANFQHANLEGMRGTASHFTGADFRGAIRLGTGTFLQAKFVDADLTDQPWPADADATTMHLLKNSIDTLNLDWFWYELSREIEIKSRPNPKPLHKEAANRRMAMRWLAKLIFDDACSYEELRDASRSFTLRMHPEQWRSAPEIILAIRHPRTAKHPMAVDTIAHMREWARIAFRKAELPYEVPTDRQWYIDNYQPSDKEKARGETQGKTRHRTARRNNSGHPRR